MRTLLATASVLIAAPAWAADDPSNANNAAPIIATGTTAAAAQGQPAPMSAEERDMLL